MSEAAEQEQALAGLDRLRSAILADPALAASLLEIWRPDAFAGAAAAAASARGVDLDPTQIADLLDGPRSRRPQALIDTLPPPGWLPTAIAGRDGEASLGWVYFGVRRLSEPFYEDELMKTALLPFNRLLSFATPLARLTPPPGALPPAGLIFHMSRCGSTLAAQMLAASDANIVVSEAAVIDEVVRGPRDAAPFDDEAQVALLRGVVGAFGQPRAGVERRLFVKLDSWHARALPLFRRAFPATPWIFLYRDPTEVLVSQMRSRGMQMVPGIVSPALLGIDWRGEPLDEDYAAQVLAAICEAAAAGLDRAGLLVSYDELPDALWRRILPHFGATPTPDEVRAMQGAAGRDAKDPTRAFRPDSADKRAEASEAARHAVRRRLAAIHRRLEAARLGQAGSSCEAER